MAKLLKPNPELADLINCCGVIPELFPNVKHTYGVMTGTMKPYLKKLRPLTTVDYGATEGWIGVNVNPTLLPESTTYVVPPNIEYFEFIPLNMYILGDVVKVMRFHNSTPELKFVHPRNLMLTINIDKNTEKDLQLVVKEAAKLVTEEKHEVPDHYSCGRVDRPPIIT
ncbi:hypothetical protein GQ457_06G031540 [Hibiscus cannabinus]